MARKRFCLLACLVFGVSLFLGGCGSSAGSSDSSKSGGAGTTTSSKPSSTDLGGEGVPASGSPGKNQAGSVQTGNDGAKLSPEQSSEEVPASGNRNNKPVVLVPEASGETVYGNEQASIDASHLEDGYVMVQYLGQVQKVKLQIKTPEDVTYTYTMREGYDVFPLTGGDGDYEISVWEQRPGKGDYVNVLHETVSVVIKDEFSPYLYPNQYVNFAPEDKTVALGSELVKGAVDDLDAVTRVFTYITENITYDTEKAQNVQSGYLPVVDEILDSGTGICFDYAAVMATMLRTQRIPTRMEIGYAGDVYHAWISTHIDGVGWVNGIIQFDGSQWQLMDPTFAANSSSDSLRDFISEGDNYQVKYIY
ncbi:MAG: transglutaminase domain-containing protein [Lachnospiraceae bacterium]|nr:transglutaminase domain-containing protein [Lachnospiraceae bacterium]